MTAYDVLKKACFKAAEEFGAGKFAMQGEEFERAIIERGVGEVYWEDRFLANIGELKIITGEDESIGGNLRGGADFGEGCERARARLKATELTFKYWVYSAYSFDDNFFMRGFETREAAQKVYEARKEKTDDIFYCFMIEV